MDRPTCLLLCLLSIVCSGVRGEQAPPSLTERGNTVLLQWNLPAFDASVLTVALQTNGTQAVFFFSGTGSGFQIDKHYGNRVNVMEELLAQGTVSFSLKRTTNDDAGHYVCIGSLGNKPIIDDCGQLLVIVDTAVDARVTASTPPVEGQNLTLECSAVSTSIPPDHGLPLKVEWFDSANSKLVPGGQEKVEVKGKTLIVRSVQRHDKNLKYSCRASDGLDMWSNQSTPYILVPEFGPRTSDVHMDRDRVEVNQGGSLQQQCSATCNPECTITWKKEQMPGDWFTLDTQDGLLDLSGIRRENAGNYRCEAENTHGSAEQKLHLIVHYAPNLHVMTVNGKAVTKERLYEKSNVTLTCQFDSSPAPIVLWYSENNRSHILERDDLRSEEPEKLDDSTSMLSRSLYTADFVLRNVLCSNTGKYVCTASNQLGSGIKGHVELDIVCMPRNTKGELRLKRLYLLPLGQNLLIKFQVEGYPQPDINRIISENERGQRQLEEEGDRWTVNKVTTSSLPYLTTFQLKIKNTTADHFDRTYYLYIGNSEGTKTLAFVLRERGAPKPPRNLTAKWVDDTQVQLHWLSGFHGGKPQSFVVQYQDAELDEKDEGAWTSVGTRLQDTDSEAQKGLELTVSALNPGQMYKFRVYANNEYGNTSSSILTVTTLATAAASSQGGAIAGAVVAVILIITIALVLIYIFVVRPRRRRQESREDVSREPMLYSNEKNADNSPTPLVEDEKPVNSVPADTANNNADDRDTSTEPLMADHKSPGDSPDNRPRNQDGLIYADLDLVEPKNVTPKLERKDAVNYETIDFTRQAPPPPPDPDHIELASDEEELPSRK